jgi:hypothetical protein
MDEPGLNYDRNSNKELAEHSEDDQEQFSSEGKETNNQV